MSQDNKQRELSKEDKDKIEAYISTCDNESGAFLSRDLMSIRRKAAKVGHYIASQKSIVIIENLKEENTKLKELLGNILAQCEFPFFSDDRIEWIECQIDKRDIVEARSALEKVEK